MQRPHLTHQETVYAAVHVVGEILFRLPIVSVTDARFEPLDPRAEEPTYTVGRQAWGKAGPLVAIVDRGMPVALETPWGRWELDRPGFRQPIPLTAAALRRMGYGATAVGQSGNLVILSVDGEDLTAAGPELEGLRIGESLAEQMWNGLTERHYAARGGRPLRAEERQELQLIEYVRRSQEEPPLTAADQWIGPSDWGLMRAQLVPRDGSVVKVTWDGKIWRYAVLDTTSNPYVPTLHLELGVLSAPHETRFLTQGEPALVVRPTTLEEVAGMMFSNEAFVAPPPVLDGPHGGLL